jgi:hypothetical protein
MGKSEVAYLLRQIELEYEAAERGLKGLAAGWARHDFINRRYEEMGRHHEELARLVGTEEATRLVYELTLGRERSARQPLPPGGQQVRQAAARAGECSGIGESEAAHV